MKTLWLSLLTAVAALAAGTETKVKLPTSHADLASGEKLLTCQTGSSGIHGLVFSLDGRLLVTATTRSATVGLTKSLAREFARHGIRANAVSIGLVRTGSLDAHTGNADDDRMAKILAAYPLRRLGTPDDVTPLVLLLASPLSSWTTGQVISVNGGYAMP